MNKIKSEAYWKKNLKYLVILLSIWFSVSFGFGILLVDEAKSNSIFRFQTWFLVCSARINICICHFNFCIHISNEQT